MADSTNPGDVKTADPSPCHLRGADFFSLFGQEPQQQQSSTSADDPDKNVVKTLAPSSGAAELPRLAYDLHGADADGRCSPCSASSTTTGYSLQNEVANGGVIVHQEHDHSRQNQKLSDDTSRDDAVARSVSVGESPNVDRMHLQPGSPLQPDVARSGNDSGQHPDYYGEADDGISVGVPRVGISNPATPEVATDTVKGEANGGDAGSLLPTATGEDALQGGGGGQATEQDEPADLPLSEAEIEGFERDGFVMLKGAFDPSVASACRDHLWKRMQGEGILQDPSTWMAKTSIAEIYGVPSSPKKRRGHPWTAALSPRLKMAVGQLVGAEAWEEFGCGWWMMTFPGFAAPPWRADGRWHVDGAHFLHYPHSREIGLVPIFLFSDILPHGGGTALLRGSHKKVADILWEHAGVTGMSGPMLSGVAREALLPAVDGDIVETVGTAGDVMLVHPLLLHARSTNLAPVGAEGVRFMCHPAVPLKNHLDFNAAPETFSPAQRVIWLSRPGADGDSNNETPFVFPTPDQCDHSSVKLPSTRKFSAGGKGWHHGGGRGRRKKRKRGNAPQRECPVGSSTQTTGAEEADSVRGQPVNSDDPRDVLGGGDVSGAATGVTDHPQDVRGIGALSGAATGSTDDPHGLLNDGDLSGETDDPQGVVYGGDLCGAATGATDVTQHVLGGGDLSGAATGATDDPQGVLGGGDLSGEATGATDDSLEHCEGVQASGVGHASGESAVLVQPRGRANVDLRGVMRGLSFKATQ